MRDFAQVKGVGTIDRSVSDFGLNALEIDERGLDATDRRILTNMVEMFCGGPVGLETLAACTGEDPVTIEDVYEPFLMQIGYIAKTPRGRVLTRLGWQHLGLECPDDYEKKVRGLGFAFAGDSAQDNAYQVQMDLDYCANIIASDDSEEASKDV